jgi:aspartyl-tRNA(Asn)/glutamyl-tRNA(Gln) amidotransferase subunit C
MPMSLDEVRHTARLARLELTDEELNAFQIELNALIEHFKDIEAVDLAGVEPKPYAMPMTNVFAQDLAEPGLDRESALASAFRSRAGLFIVPTIIEE